MDQVTVHVETQIYPTENEDKVKAAVSSLFGNLAIALETDGKVCLLTAEAAGQESLTKFRIILRSDRIRDAARRALLHSIMGSTIGFCLNKQVAQAGQISFCEETAESPLGPIRVTITADSPQLLVEWLAEKSER
jgi:predicted RNA binding protein with dsRBD fold (UPF0201 family)